MVDIRPPAHPEIVPFRSAKMKRADVLGVPGVRRNLALNNVPSGEKVCQGACSSVVLQRFAARHRECLEPACLPSWLRATFRYAVVGIWTRNQHRVQEVPRCAIAMRIPSGYPLLGQG